MTPKKYTVIRENGVFNEVYTYLLWRKCKYYRLPFTAVYLQLNGGVHVVHVHDRVQVLLK